MQSEAERRKIDITRFAASVLRSSWIHVRLVTMVAGTAGFAVLTDEAKIKAAGKTSVPLKAL
jgi:hypothetical protein